MVSATPEVGEPSVSKSDVVAGIAGGRLEMKGKVVLEGVDVAFVAGTATAILGANGSGKTTLLRCLAAVKPLASGTRTGPPRCAYVPASTAAQRLSVEEWLSSVPRTGPSRVEETLEVLGFRGDHDGPVQSLSFGNRRKLMLAEALGSDCRLLVIDEATAGLDRRGLRGLHHLVRKRAESGTCIVVADQEIKPISFLDAAYHLVDGSAVVADPREFGQSEQVEQVLLSGRPDRIQRVTAYAQKLGVHEVFADDS